MANYTIYADGFACGYGHSKTSKLVFLLYTCLEICTILEKDSTGAFHSCNGNVSV